MSEKGPLEAAVAAVFGGASALGYSLTQNPRGFVLAVVYDALVGFLQGLANSVAYRLDQTWGLLTESVVGGLMYALGTPSRLLGALVLGLIERVSGIGADVAASAGPIGFLALPAVWAVTIVGLVALVIATWRLYKWIRTVIV